MDASTVDRKLLNVLASTRDTAEDVDGSDKLMGPGALVCVVNELQRSAPSLSDFAARLSSDSASQERSDTGYM